MNQTQKRLYIIKLAISITDEETIQLQMSKLAPLKSDAYIYAILESLEKKNIVHAERLITQYIETPVEKIHIRHQEESFSSSQQVAEPFKNTPHFQEDFDEVFDDKNSTSPIQTPQPASIETFQDAPPQSLNLDIPVMLDGIGFSKQKKDTNEFEEAIRYDPPVINDSLAMNSSFSPLASSLDSRPSLDTAAINMSISEYDSPPVTNRFGRVMPHIQEKFLRYYLQIVHKEPQQFTETALIVLHHIKNGNYSDSDIEKYLYKALELSKIEESKEEARQLLILCASIENALGRLILARELFKGILIPKNTQEAFERLTQLVIEGNPDAMCDLGQIYEHAIGVKRDKKKAKALYKEAKELGLKRAERLYDNI